MDIFRLALDKGHLISYDVLDILQKDSGVLDSIPKESIVVTSKLLGAEKREPKFSVEYQYVKKQDERKIVNLVEFYSSRLDKLRNEILKKIDQKNLVSIKNVGATGEESTVIGMVRELTERGAVLDDGTGSVEVVTDKKLLDDTVVGVVGKMSEGRLLSTNVLFPDVPARGAKTSSGKGLFLKGKIPENVESLVAEGVTHVFIDSPSEEDLKTLSSFDVDLIITNGRAGVGMPARISVGGLKIFLFENNLLSQDDAITYLRSRHLNPTQFLDGDPLLLTEIPDIAVCMSAKPFFANYKGTTLFSPASVSYLVDFGTRETKEIKY